MVILGLVAAAVIASALVGWRFARESSPVGGPILLISIDPLPTSGLAAYGGSGRLTPHLDRLAGDAVVFTRASAHAAAALPAHAALLTGTLPFAHGLRDDVGFTLAEGADTLASRLAERDFATAAEVSSFLLRPGTGLARGFQRYEAPPGGAAEPGAPPDVVRAAEATARAAASWIEAQDSERFFQFLHLDASSLAPMAPDGTRGLRMAEAVILEADRAAGSVIEAVRRKGWYDAALVIVTAASAAPWDAPEQRPFVLTDDALHVPLLVKMPGTTAGTRLDDPIQHIDLTPTVLDLVRAPGSAALPGRSFRAALEGDDGPGAEAPRYAEALSGALRFGWPALRTPATPDAFPGSTTPASPAPADEATRAALARLGQVAPTLLPATPPAAPLPEPAPSDLAPFLAAYVSAARHEADRALVPAVAAYREVVSRQPAEANAWYRLGVAAARLGRVDEAQGAFDRVDALRPGSGDGTLAAARFDIDRGALDGAAGRLERLLAATPEVAAPIAAAAHALAAEVAAIRRQRVVARQHAEAARLAAPDIDVTQFVGAVLQHGAGRYADALAALDALTASTDGSAPPGLEWYRGDCLARLGRHEEALAAFERQVAVAPFDTRAHAGLVTSHHALGHTAEAAAAVEALVRQVPTPGGYATAVRLSQTIGDRERATQLRDEARQRFAGEPGLRLLPR
ncbi:MAG: sulfatase-like hydrolase/transferase [Vicinamibacterales bacterium]